MGLLTQSSRSRVPLIVGGVAAVLAAAVTISGAPPTAAPGKVIGVERPIAAQADPLVAVYDAYAEAARAASPLGERGRRGHYTEWLPTLVAAVEAFPNSPRASTLLEQAAVLASTLGDAERADELMKQALSKAPSPARRVSALHELGNFAHARYLRGGDQADGKLAITYWEQALAESDRAGMRDGVAAARRVSETANLATLYREVNREPGKAAAVLKGVLEIAEAPPQDEPMLRGAFALEPLLREQMVALLEAGRTGESAAVLRRLTELPDLKSSPVRYADLYARTADPRRGTGWAVLVNVWLSTRAATEEDVRLRLQAADLLIKGGRPDDAVTLLRGVRDYFAAVDRPLTAEEDGLYQRTFERLGRQSLKSGDVAGAERLLEALERLAPDDAAATTLEAGILSARAEAAREAGKPRP